MVTTSYRARVNAALVLLDDPAMLEQAKTLLRTIVEVPEETWQLLERQGQSLTEAQRAVLDGDAEVQAMMLRLASDEDDEEYFEANPDGSPSDRRVS